MKITLRTGVLVALVGIGFVCGTSCVQAAQQASLEGTRYSFQRHFKTGDVDLNKVDMVVTINGPATGGKDRSVKYTIVARETVQSATPDGAMTFVLEYDQATAAFDGQTLDFTAKMPRATIVRDREGRTRTSIESTNDPNALMMVKLMTTARRVVRTGAPDRPVKVGETWNITGFDPDIKGSGAGGLDSIENFNGAKLLKVNYRTDTADANAAVSRTHTGATMWIEAETGKTIKMACRTEGVLEGEKTTVDIQFNRLDDPNALFSAPRRVYHVGDVDRYQFHVAGTGDPQAGGDSVIKYTLLLREMVKEVAADGTVTCVNEAEKAHIANGNAELDITAMMPTITQTRYAQGGFSLKVEGGDAQLVNLLLPMMAQIGRAQSDSFPPRPLRIGAGWTFARNDAADLKTTGAAALEATENFTGAKALRIKCVSDKVGTSVRSRDEATVWMDALTGKTLRINARTTSAMGGIKTAIEVVYSLVGDNDKAQEVGDAKGK